MLLATRFIREPFDELIQQVPGTNFGERLAVRPGFADLVFDFLPQGAGRGWSILAGGSGW